MGVASTSVSAALRWRAMLWLVGDTFFQAQATGIVWVLLTVTGLCFALCLSTTVSQTGDLDRSEPVPEFLPAHVMARYRHAHVATLVASPPLVAAGYAYLVEYQFRKEAERTGVMRPGGRLHLAFGLVTVPVGRDAQDAVRFLQILLAGIVADTVGLLLALVWTAGFLPAFLEPHAVSVLLMKPLPRWRLLVGKFLGVLALVATYAVLFVGLTWLALLWTTGITDPTYLLAVPMLIVHFLCFFSFSMLLAVLTRSTVVCVLGSLLFWTLCWLANYARHATYTLWAQPGFEGLGLTRWLVEAGYWMLPKPADLHILLFQFMDAKNYLPPVLEFETMRQAGGFAPVLSVAASVLFSLLTIWAAAQHFDEVDY